MKLKIYNFLKTILNHKKKNIYLIGLITLLIYKNRYLVNKTKAIDFVIKNPNWKLSLQTHKYIGIK